MHPLFFDSATLIITKSKADTRNFLIFWLILDKSGTTASCLDDLDLSDAAGICSGGLVKERKCKDEHCPGVTSSQSGPLAALLTELTS